MDPVPSHAPRLFDERDLARLLAESERSVVVASHFAGWAKPWLALGEDDWRVLRAELAARADFARIETGTNRAFAARHGLEILPEVLVFRAGRVVARLHGRVDAARVIAALREVHAREEAENHARRELLAIEGRREPISPMRSLLRQRVDPLAEHALQESAGLALAHAG